MVNGAIGHNLNKNTSFLPYKYACLLTNIVSSVYNGWYITSVSTALSIALKSRKRYDFLIRVSLKTNLPSSIAQVEPKTAPKYTVVTPTIKATIDGIKGYINKLLLRHVF